MWDNGCTQVAVKPTRGDSLLDVLIVRPESTLISCETVHGISEHCGVFLEVDWIEKGTVPYEKRLIPMYHKANVLGLQTFLRDMLPVWVNNCSCVEDIWKNHKEIVFDGIERFVPHKILKPNRDPEHFNREVKRLKIRVRKAYNMRKLGDFYQAELKSCPVNC